LQFTNATTPQSNHTVVKVLQESQINVGRDVEFISYLHQTEDLVAKQLKENSTSQPPQPINPEDLSEKDCIIICRSSLKRWSRSNLCEEEIWVYPRKIELLQKSIEEDGYGAPISFLERHRMQRCRNSKQLWLWRLGNRPTLVQSRAQI
jgi:hypothetical protein